MNLNADHTWPARSPRNPLKPDHLEGLTMVAYGNGGRASARFDDSMLAGLVD